MLEDDDSRNANMPGATQDATLLCICAHAIYRSLEWDNYPEFLVNLCASFGTKDYSRWNYKGPHETGQ